MLFRKKYTVRHYGEQSIVNGYAQQSYTDTVQALDVQPDTNQLEALAEGATTIGRLRVWSSHPISAADQNTQKKGDCIFWKGHWYECTKSEDWDGTPLKHYCSSFTIVPEMHEGDV